MNFETILFYFFAASVVFSALRVITARNPLHSVLFLVLAFVSSSGIWLLLEAEFLAIALVLVYVGAVMVLFLFVVMMLDINIEKLRKDFLQWLPAGALLATLIVVQMVWVLGDKAASAGMTAVKHAADYSNTKELGRLIYTDYVYPFELAAVLLLVAMVAAIALTFRRRRDSKRQDVSWQVNVKRNDRVRIISMPATKKNEVNGAAEAHTAD
ncbi:MAG: NADH-quinone oxidoreductase subunit J [Gammaproteobacteria bacterium]|jgi:NADH-quinone oxidoreductase subunit J|nr:NADH-quinone oxidoreductase subunit J [Sideroxydans sp.]MBU3904312.1 NADH-quinone oxidoreductase subunit J [Gammaproteobacteria bacterium]MBU4045058.1 NADH-quinone oxidoreductase subunit J [Gammaproteobacteria bacterium]MBU4150915.1 NADH-quinone oxidoreductase subunit J [Gammaproteobacteria bacterium]